MRDIGNRKQFPLWWGRSLFHVFNWKLGVWSAVAQWFPAFLAVYPAGVTTAMGYATLHSLFRVVWSGFFGGWTERLARDAASRWKGYLRGVLYPSVTSNLIAWGYHLLIGNPEATSTALYAFLVSAFVYAPSTIFLISHPRTRRYFARPGAPEKIVDGPDGAG